MSETSDLEYTLGVWRETQGSGHEVEGKVIVSELDWTRYEEATGRIHALNQRLTLKMVEKNALELQTLSGYYELLFGSRRDREEGRLDPRDAAFHLMSAVVNWLASFRLYLDHEETRIARQYGKPSDDLVRFKKATADVYDASFAYRIISRFRNYVLHCGLPISTVSMRTVDSPTSRQEIAFTIDRDMLLAGFDWGRADADLRAQPKNIDVFALIDEAMHGLRVIAHEVLRIDTDRALGGLSDIREALDRLGPVDGNPILVSFNVQSSEVVEFTPVPMLVESDVSRLESAAEADDPLEVLATLPQMPPLPAPLPDPTRYRVDRAVALMSRWSEEGGATGNYHRFAQDLIEEDDGSPEPLLTGMVWVASYALAIAGGALGTTAQSILGGLAPHDVT